MNLGAVGISGSHRGCASIGIRVGGGASVGTRKEETSMVGNRIGLSTVGTGEGVTVGIGIWIFKGMRVAARGFLSDSMYSSKVMVGTDIALRSGPTSSLFSSPRVLTRNADTATARTAIAAIDLNLEPFQSRPPLAPGCLGGLGGRLPRDVRLALSLLPEVERPPLPLSSRSYSAL